ncbi:hypothetical protein CLCR_02691 [Cladophialophora carrionii]|uniref:Uncharacterized protein n=1 Tax=Cladophialophora carrionii TaxID=86049 RepID=A0A1C1CEM1_9EURO|nr:hypothetical protein CLCR_02691 [Cladophialophora carrionii]
MSQYVDPYDTTPKSMAPPPAYPGGGSGNTQTGPNVVVMQETNIDVTVLHAETKPQATTHITQVNQNNSNGGANGDDCGLGFCCGCCTAMLFCSVM